MDSAGSSPALEIRHKTQRSHDSGAYLDWSSEDSASPTCTDAFNVSGEFVTVVSVGSGKTDAVREVDASSSASGPEPASDVPFVTVLAIGTAGEDKTGVSSLNVGGDGADAATIEGHVEEEVLVYRLPGERLGFGLKFEGGIKSAEKVKRLFIQSCAQDSPASRARCSWGTLEEGDQLIDVDGVPVNTMTRIDCVRCLKESHVVIKLFVRHQMSDMTHTVDMTDARRKLGLELKATQSMPLASNDQSFSPLSPAKSTGDLPLVISAEMKKCLPQPSLPPPIPPRKVPRKPAVASSKDVTGSGGIVGPPSGFCDGQSPKAAVRTSLQHETPMRQDVEYKSAPTTPRVRQRLPPASPRVEARHSYQSSPEVSRHMGKRLSGFNAPPEAEVYLDLLALEEMNRLRNESESDDTGSSLSTVVDRFSTTNSSFSDLRSSASSTCDLTTPSTPTSTSTPSIDLARVLGPFEQLEREFSSNCRVDDDFLLTKLVASEESFSKLQRNKGVSAEQVSILLAASSRASEDDPMTLQPPPNFQDYPLINSPEQSSTLTTKPPSNYNNVQLSDDVGAQVGDDSIQLKPRTAVESSADKEGDSPALPPKPIPRKSESSRFRSGKKRPPPPPPPRNDRPQCPNPSQSAGAEEAADDEAPLVDVDLSQPSQQPPQGAAAPDEPEIIERYPVSGSYLPRLVDVMPKSQIKTHPLDTKLNDDEDDEPISLDFSVLDETEDISISVPQLCLGGGPSECTMSAADLEDTPVVAVLSEDGGPTLTLEADEARILEDNSEFQITAVTCASDVFFPYHWSITSHLATIGEVEEDETPEQTSTSSLCDVDVVGSGDASASPRETDEPVGVLGSGALRRPIYEPVEFAATMEDSDDDESKTGQSSSAAKEPISEENGDVKRFQSDAQHQKLQNERGLDGTVTRSQRKEAPRSADVLDGPVRFSASTTVSDEHIQQAGDDHQITKVATDVNPSADSIDKGVRGTMDALLALDSLTASTTLATKAPPSIAYPPPQSSLSDASLSPPPSFSRLPPDGHEFPPNYQEPNHFSVGITAHIEMDLNMPEKMPVDSVLTKPSNDFSPPPLPVSAPPQKKQTHYSESSTNLTPPVRKFSSSSTSSGPDDGPPRPRPPAWRKDEKSEKSVRDKIAMFASQEDSSLPQPVQNGARRLSSHSFKSSENIFYDDDMVDCSSGSLPSGKVLSRSIVSVDKISQSNNSYPYRQPTKATNSVTQSYKDFAPYGSTGDVSFVAPASARSEESTRSLEYSTRTLSSVDLTSPSSYNHPSIDVTHSSNPNSYGYSSTLPRKMNSNRQTPAPTPFATLQRKHTTTETPRISNSPAGTDHLHSRSQSLIDVVSAARPARHSISHDGSKGSTEETRRASLNALVEQRRRSMSKLRGLVIPEKVSEVSSNHTIFDLPEIKSRDSILATKPPLLTKDDARFVNNQQSQPTHNWVSKNNSYSSFEKPTSTNVSLSANLITPPWKCQTPASNLPKYSPAFKRKSLAVCGSSTASSVSSSLNSSREELRPSESRGKKSPLPPTKPPRNSTSMSNNLHSTNHTPSNYTVPFMYNPEPPKSLESLTSPTRSDSSFDYIRDSSPDLSITKNDIIKNNNTILNVDHTKMPLNHSIKIMSDTGRSGEDDSDNDSAVSSSRSSISHEFSPPQSPIPDSASRDNQHHTTRQHILLSPLPSSGSGNDRRPLRRTLSSETTASVASSTASTLTSGSQASCSSNGGSSSDSNSKRVLKPKSVEAINRKNVLSSARYSSGRDLKVGSPLIQRKFEDEEERSDVDEGEDETLHDDSDMDQSTSGGEMEQSKDLMYYSSYTTPDEVDENEVKIAYLNIVNPDHDFDTLEDPHEEIDRIVSKVMLEEEIKASAIPALPKAAPRRTNVSTHEHIPPYETNGKKHSSESIPLPISIEDEVDGSDKLGNQAQKQAITFDIKSAKVSSQENGQLNGIDRRKISPTLNGHVVNGISPSSVEPNKPIQRRNSNRLSSEAAPEAKSPENDLMNLLQGTQRIERQKSNDERQKKKEDTSRPLPPTEKDVEVVSPPAISRIPTTTARVATNRRSVSVNDIRKAFEKAELALNSSGRASNGNKAVNGSGGFVNNHHARVSSLDSTTSEDNYTMQPPQYGSVSNLQREQYGSITSLASTTSLISQQELQVLIDEANQTLEELGGGSPPVHEVLVVVLHREVVGGSVGITLAGGADYEAKEITVHKVLGGSPADRDGRIQKGDRILSINGKSMKGVTHRESQNILKTPRSEVILVISRPRPESVDCSAVTSNSTRPPRILENLQEVETMNGLGEVARGPPVIVMLPKEGAGLGFSLEGGKDSPLGDKPLIIKKIFMGGSADKSGQLQAGDELLKVNESDLTAMTRIEAWGLMKKLPDGKVSLTVRHAVENKPR